MIRLTTHILIPTRAYRILRNTHFHVENKIFCFPHHCGDLKECLVVSRISEAHEIGLITKISQDLSLEFCQRYVVIQTIHMPLRDTVARVPG